MNNVLFNYLNNFYTAYLNNIMIYSENKLEHKTYVKKVLECLWNTGLQVDIRKCEFRVKCTKYLRFIVSTNSIKVDLEKVKVV
jgi:hypothetical protein